MPLVVAASVSSSCRTFDFDVAKIKRNSDSCKESGNLLREFNEHKNSPSGADREKN